MRIAIVEDYDAERQPMAVMCTEYFKRSHANGITARRRSIMTAHRSALPSCCVWMIEIPVRRRPITVRSSPRMAASHGFRRVEI